MDHDVGSVEHIMPEWDLLNINKIDDAAVYQSIGNIAGSASDHKSKADVLIAFKCWTEDEVGRDAQQQADTDQAKKLVYKKYPMPHSRVCLRISYKEEFYWTIYLLFEERIAHRNDFLPLPSYRLFYL